MTYHGEKKIAIKFIAFFFAPVKVILRIFFPLNSAEIMAKKCKDGWLLKRLNPQIGRRGARSWNDIKDHCMPIT